MTITAFLTVELDGLLIDPAVTLASGSKPLATRLVLAERQTPKGAALCLAIPLCALSASLATIVNTRSDAEGAQAEWGGKDSTYHRVRRPRRADWGELHCTFVGLATDWYFNRRKTLQERRIDTGQVRAEIAAGMAAAVAQELKRSHEK